MGRVARLMTDTVTLASQTGKSSSGDPTYGAQSTIKARVEHKRVVALDASGNEVSADHVLTSESEVKLSDRVWLPGDDTTKTNSARRAISVGKAATLDGYTLYTATF